MFAWKSHNDLGNRIGFELLLHLFLCFMEIYWAKLLSRMKVPYIVGCQQGRVSINPSALHSQQCDRERSCKIDWKSLFLLLFDHLVCFVTVYTSCESDLMTGHVKYMPGIRKMCLDLGPWSIIITWQSVWICEGQGGNPIGKVLAILISNLVGRLWTSCRQILSALFLTLHSKGRVHGLQKTWVDRWHLVSNFTVGPYCVIPTATLNALK